MKRCVEGLNSTVRMVDCQCGANQYLAKQCTNLFADFFKCEQSSRDLLILALCFHANDSLNDSLQHVVSRFSFLTCNVLQLPCSTLYNHILYSVRHIEFLNQKSSVERFTLFYLIVILFLSIAIRAIDLWTWRKEQGLRNGGKRWKIQCWNQNEDRRPDWKPGFRK